MNRDQKTAVVEEIAGQIQAAEAIFAVDYRGISVSQVAELRGKLRGADTRFRIVKNSLTERAADKAGVEALKPLLEGPTALALVQGDAALAAKALNDTARALGILEFKGGLMNGATVSSDDIRSIARLPGREILNAQLVGTIAAPISGLVRGLNAMIAGLAVQLKAIADQGLVSGAAPAEETAPAEPPSPEPEPEPEPRAPEEEPEATAAESEGEGEPEPAGEPEAAQPAEAEPVQSEDTEPEASADAEPSDA